MIRDHSLVVLLLGVFIAAGSWGCGSSGSGMGDDTSATGAAGTGRGGVTVGAPKSTDSGSGSQMGTITIEPGSGTSSGSGMAGAGAEPATANMAPSSCMIDSSLTMSTAVSTVAIVEFSTDLPTVDSAYIEFGLDESYGMKAPVDLQEPNFRTVLLGMKTEREYHYRIVAISGDRRCTGPDNTLQTGSLPHQIGLLSIDIQTPQPDKVAKGFILAGHVKTGPTFILDSDGDYVWWFDSGDMTHARMSYDGKYIWTQALNWANGAASGGGFQFGGTGPGGHPLIHRVSVDGMDVETYGLDEFGDPTHDFDVTPDGSYIMPDHNTGNGCMKIVERTADGQRHDIIRVDQADGGIACLVNSIHYWPADDTITFSDLLNNCYVKMTRTGQVLWVLGGAHSTFTNGDAISWTGQHGHQVLGPDRFLMFNNAINPASGQHENGNSSMAYEIKLDQATKTATRVWQYDGGLQTYAFGDVQRLPNGNTLVNYGVKGTIHEVDPDGNLVRSMAWAIGGAIAYVDWRSSLYGPPDK